MESYLHRGAQDALASGQVVLVVHARTEAETSIAQDVVSQHLGPLEARVSSEAQAAVPVAV